MKGYANMQDDSNNARTDATELASINSDVLSHRAEHSWSVREVEQALSALFPPSDALDWDRTGLVVGNPYDKVEGIAVALDPTVEAVKTAESLGINVLVTHHPPYIAPPETLIAPGSGASGSQLSVWQAARSNVNLLCYHTALDVSVQASQVLPGLLSLPFERILEPLQQDACKGFGQVCSLRDEDAGYTLRMLAARCVAVFGRQPRVWGPESMRIESVVTATGSGGSLVQSCLDAGVDCLVCGEVHYHDAVHAREAGLSIIELGHDVSELPLCGVLASALEASGYPADKIAHIDQSFNWWIPEASRR